MQFLCECKKLNVKSTAMQGAPAKILPKAPNKPGSLITANTPVIPDLTLMIKQRKGRGGLCALFSILCCVEPLTVVAD